MIVGFGDGKITHAEVYDVFNQLHPNQSAKSQACLSKIVGKYDKFGSVEVQTNQYKKN